MSQISDVWVFFQKIILFTTTLFTLNTNTTPKIVSQTYIAENKSVVQVLPIEKDSNKENLEKLVPTEVKISTPIQIEIPAINLSSKVEIEGLNDEGLMEIPDEGKTVGWFKYGPQPGKTGNSVIAGHYDTNNGPAIFYNLNFVKVGDQILVTDKNGNKLSFEIYKKEIVAVKNFDVDKVYGPSDDKNLNLITCNGSYDPELKTYNKRLIIYSKLITLTNI